MIKKKVLFAACLTHFFTAAHCSFDFNQFMAMSDDAFGGGFGDPVSSQADWSGGGFEDLFGGAGDSFDFGNSFDFGDGGDFGALFGQSNSEAPPHNEAMQGGAPEKKEILPPEAKSLRDAFETGVKPEVTKLTPQYKEALKHYLGDAAEKLYALQKYIASSALGAKYKRELGSTPATINEAASLIDRLKNESVYHLTLYTKGFEKSRATILKLPESLAAPLAAYHELEENQDESLKAKSSSTHLAKRKKLFSSIQSLSKKELSPLIDELKKILEDKKTTEAIAAKKKKYAARVGGSAAAAAGGWQSGARNYFDDGATFGNYGSNSWNGGGDYWSNDFGSYGGSFADYGDAGWGYGNNDGYGDYGYSGNWGASSSSTPSPSGGSGNTSSSPAQTVYGRTSSPSGGNEDWSFGDEANTKKISKAASAESPQAISELTPEQQRAKLLQSLPQSLNRWRTEYERAQGKGPRTAAVKSILAEPGFGTTMEHLALFASLDPTHQKSPTAEEETLAHAINAAVPLLAHAATYTTPALDALFDESTTEKRAGASTQAAKEKIRAQAYQRARSHKALLAWLKAVRERQNDHKKLFKRILQELLGHAQTTLYAIRTLLKRVSQNTLPLSFDQTLALTTLSRQLFHEPIVSGYALLSSAAPEAAGPAEEAPATQINDLIALKQEVEQAISPVIEEQYARVHDAIEAAENTMTRVKEGVDSGSFAASFQGELSAPDEIKTLLVPYSKNRYRALEMQHALLSELMRYWSKKPMPHDDADAKGQDDEVLEQREDSESTNQPE